MRLAVFSPAWKHAVALRGGTTTGGCTIADAAPVDQADPAAAVYIDGQHFDHFGLATLMAAGAEIRDGEGEPSEVAVSGTLWQPDPALIQAAVTGSPWPPVEES